MVRDGKLPLYSIRIRECRKRYGLSQPGLAHELDRLAWERASRPAEWMPLGVNGSMVSRWERGTRPRQNYQQLLCALFNLTRYELGFRQRLPREVHEPRDTTVEQPFHRLASTEPRAGASASASTMDAVVPAYTFDRWPLLWLPTAREDDMDPINRRSLLGKGVAFGLGATFAARTPASAADVDPELVPHWLRLLDALSDYDRTVGPRAVLGVATSELTVIERHRKAARGVLRNDLRRVESRWADYAAWLSDDTGDEAAAGYWLDRALKVAEDADDRLMASFVLAHGSRLACDDGDVARAVALAQAAQQRSGLTTPVRAIGALREARARAQAGERAACEHKLNSAHELVATLHTPNDAPRFESLGSGSMTPTYAQLYEADCWLRLNRPRDAITIFERVLKSWPSTRPRDRALHGARLAVACAAAGETDRAVAEGLAAIEIAKATRSDRTTRELNRLDRQLATSNAPAAIEYHQALATL